MSLVPDSLSASKVMDAHDRPLGSLRLSVTDRCNLRCQYCMPEEDYVWLPREDVLSFEEMATLTGYFADLGVDKVRLTGGEPLLRRDLSRLVRLLLQDRRISEIALTTNGILLADNAQELYEAGLHRVTVSLDTLRPERFRQLTRRDEFARVIEGIESVGRAGFTGLKLDTVAIRGFNDDELVESAVGETQLFFTELLQRDLPARNLVVVNGHGGNRGILEALGRESLAIQR